MPPKKKKGKKKKEIVIIEDEKMLRVIGEHKEAEITAQYFVNLFFGNICNAFTQVSKI